MNRNIPAFRVLSITAILLAALLPAFLAGCKSTPEPVEEVVEPEALPEPVEEPEPFAFDWAGTTWIYRDVPEGSQEFPGYRGFHLAGDGRLMLVNMDEAIGDSWTAEGEYLTLSLAEGSADPSLAIKGRFRPLVPEDVQVQAAAADPQKLKPGVTRMLLGDIIFELAGVNVDVVENHWIPMDMERGDTVMWPMSREIHLMLLPEASGGMGILGYGGENRFRGGVTLGSYEFIPGLLSMTRKTGPASNFEMVYVDNIAAANRYVQVDDDLFLYRDSVPKVAFRVRLFD